MEWVAEANRNENVSNPFRDAYNVALQVASDEYVGHAQGLKWHRYRIVMPFRFYGVTDFKKLWRVQVATSFEHRYAILSAERCVVARYTKYFGAFLSARCSYTCSDGQFGVEEHSGEGLSALLCACAQ